MKDITIVEKQEKVYSYFSIENLTLKGDFQIELLKKAPEYYFLPTHDVILDDKTLLTICDKNTNNSFTDIHNNTEVEKILLLINIGEILLSDRRQYLTTFAPENIYFQNDYKVFFAFRIISNMVDINWKERELEEYKSLILSVFQDKYTYEKLIEIGFDTLDDKEEYLDIINAKDIEELHNILKTSYDEKYKKSKEGMVGFPVQKIKIFTISISAVFSILLVCLIYFVYRNVTLTDQYRISKNIYESHYTKNPEQVLEYASQLKNKNIDVNLGMVIADSLLAVGGTENIEKAFYYDPSRQIECIEALVDEESYDIIARLHSDKNKVQMYQAFYAKDYKRAIHLAETNIDLKYDAQAQVLLSRAYMNIGNYGEAVNIVDSLGDSKLQLEIYKQYREDIYNNETNIEIRKELIESLDTIIEILEDSDSKGEN